MEICGKIYPWHLPGVSASSGYDKGFFQSAVGIDYSGFNANCEYKGFYTWLTRTPAGHLSCLQLHLLGVSKYFSFEPYLTSLCQLNHISEYLDIRYEFTFRNQCGSLRSCREVLLCPVHCKSGIIMHSREGPFRSWYYTTQKPRTGGGSPLVGLCLICQVARPFLLVILHQYDCHVAPPIHRTRRAVNTASVCYSFRIMYSEG